jgi:Protein of unknown function (DUF1552)
MKISRRRILQGGAVALSLPWLETLAPRPARGAAAPIKRYISMYYPNGTTPNFWNPTAAGAGNAWAISPILEPLSAFKANMLVLGNVGNYSAMGVTATAQPSHGTNCAGAWHCYDPRKGSDSAPGGGISVDQVIAGQIGAATRLPSLQVGLSTIDSYCDGAPCAHSRSISWAGPNVPMGKIVNPQTVFDKLVSAGAPTTVGPGTTPTTPMTTDPKLAQTRALHKSVLDSVLAASTSLRAKLSMSDQARVDQYMTSVRDLEKLVAAPAMQVTGGGGATVSCAGQTRPPEAYADMNVPADYSRETHANIMIQLVTMAFACDLTRTVSFMLDDARSEYVYSHVPMRKFNAPAAGMLSSPGTGTCADYHGLQHAGDNNDGFATITYWNAQKAAMMAQALASISEGGGTALDGAVIHFGSGMHGGNHDGLNIPMVLIGSGGGVLKQNAYVQMTGDAPGGGARLANLHLTLIQKVFGSSVGTFGAPGASTGILPGVLV